MKKKNLSLLFPIITTASCFAGGFDDLIGKRFMLDKQMTHKLTRENQIFSEAVIQKLEKLDDLIIKWEKGRIEVETPEGLATAKVQVLLDSEKKIILYVEDADGKPIKTTITLTSDGYWQETEIKKGYLEKFVLYQKTSKSNKSH